MIEWTDEQKELRNSIAEWAPALNENYTADSEEELFLKKWETVKQMGILGLSMDESYGGLSQNVLTTMYVMEEFGKTSQDAGFSFGVSSHIVSTCVPMQKFGTDEQKQQYLPGLIAGDIIGAHAITETESGSDAWDMSTWAEKIDGGYRINGSKTFTSNGPVADTIIVYARTDKNASILNGFTAFIVDTKSKGFSRSRPMKKMGLETSVLCDLYFDDLEVSDSNILGKVGKGFPIFNYVMKWEILLSFIINVGEMQLLLEKCVDYSKNRKQYGQPICKYQAVSHKIAEMKINLETARTMMYRAGYGMSRNRNITTDLAIAKVVASENFVKNSLDALQVFGGAGYMKESGIERYVRNSVASKIYSGTSEIQRNTIASMLGL